MNPLSLPRTVARALSSEEGNGSVLAVGVMAALAAATGSLLLVCPAVAAGQRAAGAADAAALAAADALSGWVTGEPCELAGRVARENTVELVGCVVRDDSVQVAVSVSVGMVTLQRVARAGPPTTTP